MANVDDRDNWRVHFADTMRGGQYLNNWRMAELHAKEAPDRVRELEAWGAVFDRTKDGRILQRNFGGHRYPRLAHVGDRTGLEMIRTLQDHGVHQGIDVLHGAHGRSRCSSTAAASPARSRYDRERGRFKVFRAKAVVLATGGIGRAYKITSNSWEYTGDGYALAYDAGAALHGHGVHPVPSDRHGLAAERAAASSSPKACAAKAASSRTRKAAGSCSTTSRTTTRAQTADNEEEGWRYTQGDKTARRPPELLTRDHVARCINREVKAGRGSPHGGVFLDIAWIKEKLPNARRAHQAQAAEHVPPVQAARRPRHHRRADGGRPDDALHDGRHSGGRRHADVDGARACSPRAKCAAGLHGANRLGGNSLSDLIVFGKRAGEYAAAVRARTHGAGAIDEAQVDAATTRRAGAVRSRRRRRESVRDPARPAGHDAGASSASSGTEAEMQRGARRARRRCKARADARRRRRQPRVQPRLAHGDRPAQPADGVRGDRARGDRAQGEPRRATSARTIPDEVRRVRRRSTS